MKADLFPFLKCSVLESGTGWLGPENIFTYHQAPCEQSSPCLFS